MQINDEASNIRFEATLFEKSPEKYGKEFYTVLNGKSRETSVINTVFKHI